MTDWVVCTQEVTNVEDQVRTLEQRAYAKAEMAASVTTGARPHVEGVRMYTHDFSLELTKLLKMGASMEVDTPAGAATGAVRVRVGRWSQEPYRSRLDCGHGSENVLVLHKGAREIPSAERLLISKYFACIQPFALN